MTQAWQERYPDGLNALQRTAINDHGVLAGGSLLVVAPTSAGKTFIGDLVKGVRDGVETELLVYNVADHKEAFAETNSQAISYTAGVPAIAAAMLIAKGDWDCHRMANVEELPPVPFIDLLGRIGLATRIRDDRGDRAFDPAEFGPRAVSETARKRGA